MNEFSGFVDSNFRRPERENTIDPAVSGQASGRRDGECGGETDGTRERWRHAARRAN